MVWLDGCEVGRSGTRGHPKYLGAILVFPHSGAKKLFVWLFFLFFFFAYCRRSCVSIYLNVF